MASVSEKGIVLSEYQKKLKTMKKKFFVLYKDTFETDARLEYYDTEKKFIQKTCPKRVILLKSCFNINQRFDTKHKFVLALSSRDGGFGIVFNSENDLRKWLDNLLLIQRDNINGKNQVYTPYEYVWQVVVQKKGMSENIGITGSYHCCLTSKSLTFICIGSEKLPNGNDRIIQVEILLTTIRRCGHASPQRIFYMELGRQSVLGPGELWMETEEATIAKFMHDMILSTMSTMSDTNMLNISKGHTDLNNEIMRERSSSTNDASRPINMLQNRQTPIEISNFSTQSSSYGRERSDSLPTRNRTLSECANRSNTVFKHRHRCNTISGSRAYSNSDNLPIQLIINCPKNEELTICGEETHNKAIFETFRMNSMPSKTIIPEENFDDDSSDNSKSGQKCRKLLNRGSNSLLISTDEKCGTYLPLGTFTETDSENIGNDADVNNLCERPSRAYSIGSKGEHIKMNKHFGNSSEMDYNSCRVRAYSVGSKSKIPRCDIQRGVIISKKMENNHKGSVCNIGVQSYTDIYDSRGIKSTSAPLLNFRNNINPIRMNDLMEIDFSNVTTANTTSLLQRSQRKLYVPKAVPTSTPAKTNNSSLNDDIKQTDKSNHEEQYKVQKQFQSPDSGYLEMKPVGNVHTTIIPDEIEKVSLPNNLQARSPESSHMHEKGLVDLETFVDLSVNKNCSNINNDAKSEQIFELKSDIDYNLEKCKLKNNKLNLALDVSNAFAGGRKLIHSISSEDYTRHKNKSNTDESKEDGYQILQIKSDSSLISNTKNKRPAHKPKCNQHFHSDAVNKKNFITTKTTNSLLTKDTNAFITEECAEFLINKEINTLNTGLCEHGLYYASLDLPQCSRKPTYKSLNSEAACETQPICNNNTNLYAKIDFDQSDSSSASSKVCNV